MPGAMLQLSSLGSTCLEGQEPLAVQGAESCDEQRTGHFGNAGQRRLPRA